MNTILVLILFLLNVINATKTLIDGNINGLIASFGDFDSDKFTDVFIITENGKSLELLKGFPTEPVLRNWTSIKCSFNNNIHYNDIIVGVIVSDFRGLATMDVLVTTKPSNATNDKHFNIWLFRGNISSLECNTSKPLVSGARSHPFVLDFNGDMISDFIVETDRCLRQLWSCGQRCSNTYPYLHSDCPLEIQPIDNQTMRFPNSNAFINLDNYEKDMTTDIYISGEQGMEYWYWMANEKQGFIKIDRVNNPYPDPQIEFKGQSAFVDINIDGEIDHILPVCGHMLDNVCKEPQILGYNWKEKSWTTLMKDFSYGNRSYTFIEIDTFGQNSAKLPITLRHGDIDGDGYIDLITVMRDIDYNINRAVVLKNKPSNNTFGRYFAIDFTSERHLKSGQNVDIVAFIDLFEDGKLDILMTTSDKDKTRSVFAVVNTQMIAACFLKVLVTSGRCYGSGCPRGNIPYGTNQFGPFVCYQLQDLDGNWQTGCAGQLSQSGHSALQMPYSVFGLGETPNFVENVYASIPSGRMTPRSSKWTQIVPDAQVVLIPYPPNETSYWILKLFYTPSNIVFSTLITLAAICCLLVLIIGILHRKELLEDLAEHEEYKRFWPESR